MTGEHKIVFGTLHDASIIIADLEEKLTSEREKSAALLAALEAITKRHEWLPAMGQCMCQEHRVAYDVLTKYRGAK